MKLRDKLRHSVENNPEGARVCIQMNFAAFTRLKNREDLKERQKARNELEEFVLRKFIPQNVERHADNLLRELELLAAVTAPDNIANRLLDKIKELRETVHQITRLE